MKKIIIIVLLFFIPSMIVNAEDTYSYDFSEVEEQLDELGEETFGESITENGESITEATPITILTSVWDMIVSEFTDPFATLGIIVGILLLFGLLSNMQIKISEGMTNTVNAVAFTGVIVIVLEPAIAIIRQMAEVVETTATFIMGFLPIMAGLLTMSGSIVTASVSNVFLMSLCQILSSIISNFILPIAYIILSFNIVSAINSSINLTAIVKSVNKFAIIFLTASTTLFVSVFTFQGIATSAADNVTLKTGKFLVGSFVPFIGSAISDATESVLACLGTIKTTAGIGSIVAIVIFFAPVMIKAILWLISLSIASMVSEVLGNPKMGEVIKSISTVIGFILSCIIAVLVMFIVSFTILIIIGVS